MEFAAEEPFQLAGAIPRLLRPRGGYAGTILREDQTGLVENLQRQGGSELSTNSEHEMSLYCPDFLRITEEAWVECDECSERCR